MGHHPTIRDVAKKACVSIATVSFVLNENPGEAISERVRKRVWAAARALDYHANASAAGLARRHTRNVAVLFHEDEDLIAHPFYSFVVQGAIKEATDKQYNLLFSYLPRTYRGPVHLPKVVQENNAEGVLCTRRVPGKIVADIQARGIPVVLLDHPPGETRANSVRVDDRTGGLLVARHLLELGHDRLFMLHATHDPPAVTERIEGFAAGLDEGGLSFGRHRGLFAAPGLSFLGGHAAARTLLSRKRRPTALFAPSDEMAAGAIRAAHELALRVPLDLSVVGFDDLSMASYTNPPLTTVGAIKEQLGRRAMGRLIELVEGPWARVECELLPVRLVVRASTACPT